MSGTTLALSGAQHRSLCAHLLPGDEREAAAILLCGTGVSSGDLIVREVLETPHAECSRRPARIVWPGARLAEAQAIAEDEDLAVVLAHSHPGGLFAFSDVDDESDAHVLGALADGWCGHSPPVVGSAIMVPGGGMRARRRNGTGALVDFDQVRVAGDDIRHWRPDAAPAEAGMAFGGAMAAELRRRRACVVGVSGTGSIVAEQLARLGFGGLVLVDFDRVERRNLNRILNAEAAHADAGVSKVAMFADAVRHHRPDIEMATVEASILSREAVAAASGCDVVFSCVDSSEGRQICDRMCRAFSIPLIDMGVSIPTRRLPGGDAAVAEVLGRVDYVQPGGSTLASREVFTPASLRAEYLRATAPDAYAAELNDGYIKGVAEEAPAVISLNMRAASAAVLEYLARAFPFRHRSNREFARTLFRLAEGEEEAFAEDEFVPDLDAVSGTGAVEPLLGLPMLGAPR